MTTQKSNGTKVPPKHRKMVRAFYKLHNDYLKRLGRAHELELRAAREFTRVGRVSSATLEKQDKALTATLDVSKALKQVWDDLRAEGLL